MNFELGDEQKILAEQARRLLSDLCSYDRLRSLIDEGAEWDADLWHAMAQMGLFGVAIPEEFGGSAMGQVELGIVSQEIGRVCAPVPFFSSVVCSAQLIALAGSQAQKAKWLPKIATGETIAVFADDPLARRSHASHRALRLDDGCLFGELPAVPDAGIADIALLPVFAGADALVVIDLRSDTVRKQKLDAFDQLQAYYALTFGGTKVEDVLAMPASGVMTTVRNIAATQAAFEAIGGAEECLHMARNYTLGRQVFARPLASFQALKHRLADVFALIELARSSAYFAGWAADHNPERLSEAAAASRLLSLDAYRQAARENLQFHGGIGYTFEANCHFHYRRERALASRLRNQSFWVDQLIAALSAPTSQERA